jgi:hypothetical protein
MEALWSGKYPVTIKNIKYNLLKDYPASTFATNRHDL